MANEEGGKKIREEGKSPFIYNPLYVSDQLSDEDIEALIALRLLQEGEPSFYDLIEKWLKEAFPNVMKRIGDPSILIEYLKDHFSIQEDWRGWRIYITKASKKFYTEGYKREIPKSKEIEEIQDQRETDGEKDDATSDFLEEKTKKHLEKKDGIWGHQNTEKEFGTWRDPKREKDFYTVERTSELTDIPEVTLYRWIKVGKVEAIRERGSMFLDKEEIEKIRDWKEKRKGLIKLIARCKGIDLESARRWIKRLENKGLNQEEILKKGKEILAEGWSQGKSKSPITTHRF